MAIRQIKISHFKGIKQLTFDVPSSGVHVLTGKNGSGKTSLLTALNRLGNNQAFAKIQVNRDAGFDKFDEADIEFVADGRSIHYRRNNKRWMPTPRGNTRDLQQLYSFSTSCYISTSGIRFYQTEPKSLEKKKGRIRFQPASDQIKNGLNQIFDTQRFSNLQYATIRDKQGRQRQLHRNNKLYSIKEGQERYSEFNFSLGEQLILNVLDFIENISAKALLIIDEIELALHPLAQIEFYKYISQLAKEKQLTCIISTHSASLIKAATQLIYLENDNGEVSVMTDCRPAYILKDITIVEDSRKDYLFFVEDEMACRYLSKVIALYQRNEDQHVRFGVIPVGGYEQVVKLMQYFKTTPPYQPKQLQAFLDKDVADTIQQIRSKDGKTDAEIKELQLFDEEREHISYLSITPEEGVWAWLEHHTSDYERAIHNRHGQGILNQPLSVLKQQVDVEEKDTGGDNPRKHAKGCFKNILEKLHQQAPHITENEFIDLLMESYVKEQYDNPVGLNKLKSVFKPIINRK